MHQIPAFVSGLLTVRRREKTAWYVFGKPCCIAFHRISIAAGKMSISPVVSFLQK
jgi:hypothetical protein